MKSTRPPQRRPAAADGRRVRWQEHRESRRAELLEAALRAVRRHGAGVGMEEIAEEAGTSKPVVYRYFADRNDLHLAVGRQVAAEVVAEVDRELAGDHEPRDLVAAVVDAYLRIIEADPEVYRFVVTAPLVGRAPRTDPVADYSEVVARHVVEAIGARLRVLGLDDAAAGPWGHGLVGLVRAAGDWWMRTPGMSRAALTASLTTLIWDGFAGVVAGAAGDGHPTTGAEQPASPG